LGNCPQRGVGRERVSFLVVSLNKDDFDRAQIPKVEGRVHAKWTSEWGVILNREPDGYAAKGHENGCYLFGVNGH